jgi:endoglucanase
MNRSLLTILLVCGSIMGWSQNNPPQQRLSIVSVTPSENTGQNYAPWLSDNMGKLVQSAWSDNLKWTQVTLKLHKKSLLTSLTLYDLHDTFADKPALLYAMNGTQRVLIGSFTGEKFAEWVTLTPTQPLVADAIMIYKYGNNIPQKIKAFGQYITETTEIPRPLDLLKMVSAKDKPVTGQDYSAYLNDDMANLVPGYWQPASAQWTDVTIKFEKKSLLTKLDLYDAEGSFESTPAEIYALNGKEKTLIGTFRGDLYQAFKTYTLSEPRVVEGIVIHKFQNAIPLKIRAYGKTLPDDPLDAILYEQERVKVISVTTNLPTPQSYAPYTNDDMASLVQYNWTPENCRWIELTLKLETRSKVTKVELYDGNDTWNDTPAEIYALNGPIRTLIGHFTGPDYLKWQELKPGQPLAADAIIIRKYCNALPLKLRCMATRTTSRMCPSRFRWGAKSQLPPAAGINSTTPATGWRACSTGTPMPISIRDTERYCQPTMPITRCCPMSR